MLAHVEYLDRARTLHVGMSWNGPHCALIDGKLSLWRRLKLRTRHDLEWLCLLIIEIVSVFAGALNQLLSFRRNEQFALIDFAATAATAAGRSRRRTANPADPAAGGRHVARFADPPELRCTLGAELADNLPLATMEKGAVLFSAQQIPLADRAERWFARC